MIIKKGNIFWIVNNKKQLYHEIFFNIFKYQKKNGKNPILTINEKIIIKNKILINLFINKFIIKNNINDDLNLWIKKYFIDVSLKLLFINKIIGIKDIILISILIQKYINEFEFIPIIILNIIIGINIIKVKFKLNISDRINLLFLNKFTIYYFNQTYHYLKYNIIN